MSNSGRKINYSLRPAKNIERKMMRDMFQRLNAYSSLSEYMYIGFGAKYFEDFSLFHRQLHIDKMISIESDMTNKKRYEFNKPFSCIDIMFGMSNHVLPKIQYTNKVVAWLDYDSRFNLDMLNDLGYLAGTVDSGSTISISYNSEIYSQGDLGSKDGKVLSYKDKFIELVGSENIPATFDERGWLDHSNFSKFLRGAALSRMERVINERNATVLGGDKFCFKQVMYFNYADGSKMTTLSYIVFKETERDLIDGCRLTELSFYRESDDDYCIEVPNLTLKEIRFLSEVMPSTEVKPIEPKIFAVKDVELFKMNYKYFPNFTEIESC
jgi:hypothetical protein